MNTEIDIPAKETWIDGIKFHSRLEGRFYEYLRDNEFNPVCHPEDFPGRQKYAPDFWLPRGEVYVEVKPYTKKKMTELDIFREDITQSERAWICVDKKNRSDWHITDFNPAFSKDEWCKACIYSLIDPLRMNGEEEKFRDWLLEKGVEPIREEGCFWVPELGMYFEVDNPRGLKMLRDKEEIYWGDDIWVAVERDDTNGWEIVLTNGTFWMAYEMHTRSHEKFDIVRMNAKEVSIEIHNPKSVNVYRTQCIPRNILKSSPESKKHSPVLQKVKRR